MNKSLWHDNPKSSSLKEVKRSTPTSNQLLIQSLYSFISIGTERTIAMGLIPQGIHSEMDVPYMEGRLQLPVKYGYSMVGKIISKQHKLEGRMVHLLHPHQSICVVENQDVFLIPDDIPPLRATLASNLETAVNAVWDAHLSIGDQVLIVGFGLIGALTAMVARQFPAVTIHIIEKDPLRQKIAQDLGFNVIDEPCENDYDIAFNTSGHESGLQAGIRAVGLEGNIMELSWYANKPVSLQLGYDFHWKRKKIISSQVSLIPLHKKNRWDYRRRKELVFQLLKNPIFDELITKVIPFEESPAFFDELRQGKNHDLGVCIQY